MSVSRDTGTELQQHRGVAHTAFGAGVCQQSSLWSSLYSSFLTALCITFHTGIAGSGGEEHLPTNTSRGHQHWWQHLSPGQQLSGGATRTWTAFDVSSVLTQSSLSRRRDGGGGAVSLQTPLHHGATEITTSPNPRLRGAGEKHKTRTSLLVFGTSFVCCLMLISPRGTSFMDFARPPQVFTLPGGRINPPKSLQ